MATDFKQYNYDAIYSNGPFSAQACGPTACADLLDISPLTTASWLTQNGFSTDQSGTKWEGIAPCLSAFGGGGKQLNLSSLLGQRTTATFEAWKKHIQTGYEGILLMGKGVSNYWTNSGHFISIVRYDKGMYQVYDPASGTRTGWYSFDSFAGNIKVCYTSEIRWGGSVVDYSFKPAKIMLGSNNDSVLLVQKILYARGMYPRKAGFDGSFGPATDKAVKEYQKFCKLDVDGIVGPLTWDSMTGIPGDTKGLKTTQIGDKSVYVLLLQEVLAADWYYAGAIDWKFGEGTRAAVRAFQKDAGLTVDGVVGPATWKKLIKI